MKKAIIIITILSLLILNGCKTISEEEAVQITQKFVNENVKFYVNEDNNSDVVNRASIAITRTAKVNDVWNIFLTISSNETGIVKKNNIVKEED